MERVSFDGFEVVWAGTRDSTQMSAARVGDVPRQTPHFLEAFLVVESDDEDEDDHEVKDTSDGVRDARDVGESDESDESSN